MGAWYLVFMMVGPLMSLLPLPKASPREKNSWILHLTFIFNLSALLASYMTDLRFFEGQISAGGFVGLTMVRALMGTLNSGGLQLVLWTTFLVQLVLLTRMSVKEILGWPARHLRMGRWPGFVGQKLHGSWRTWLQALRQDMAERSKKALALKTAAQKAVVKKVESAAASAKSSGKQTEDSRGQFIPLESAQSSDGAGAIANGAVAISDRAIAGADHRVIDFLPIETSDERPVGRKRIVKPVSTPKRVAQWDMPKIDLLEDPPLTRIRIDEKEIRRNVFRKKRPFTNLD